MIKEHGFIDMTNDMFQLAETIKFQNYKTNTPKSFQKVFGGKESIKFIEDLSDILDIPINKLDYVYFSVCQGAKPHADQLDPLRFKNRTFVIPLIAPEHTLLKVEGDWRYIKIGNIYEFDHTKIHELEVNDKEHGCVVLMVSELM